MNKKLLVGTAALTTVAVGGYLYYRWVRSEPLSLFLEDESNEEELSEHVRKLTPEQQARLVEILDANEAAREAGYRSPRDGQRPVRHAES